MKIIVGTTNSKKISYLRHYFLDDEIVGVSVSSGVSNQPLSEAEVAEGAYTRAKKALESDSGDFGVGMEGGLQEGLDGLLYYVCVVVMLDKQNKSYMGISSKLPAPKNISDGVKMGKFFIDEVSAMEQRSELIEQLISREKMFKEAVENLVTAYQNKDLF